MQKIFVGDVQGCAAELEELLERARAHFGTAFEVYFVGDLVNRGPANLRVLQIVRELVEAGRGYAVLGNHDVSLLRVACGLRSLGGRDTFADVLDAPDGAEWLDWLRGLPVCVEGRIEDSPFVVVHASVAAEWTRADLMERNRAVMERLASEASARSFLRMPPSGAALRDDFDRLLCCRSVGASGWSAVPPEDGAAMEPWWGPWTRHGHDYGVVYGHWSLAGLHVAPGLRGIDTGCVHHGRDSEGFLTAWLPKARRANVFAVPDDDFWRIRAHRRYVW